jgi:hypothetical protein
MTGNILKKNVIKTQFSAKIFTGSLVNKFKAIRLFTIYVDLATFYLKKKGKYIKNENT